MLLLSLECVSVCVHVCVCALVRTRGFRLRLLKLRADVHTDWPEAKPESVCSRALGRCAGLVARGDRRERLIARGRRQLLWFAAEHVFVSSKP